MAYDTFGKLTSETNPAVDSLFLFTGRPFDQNSQLQNNLNRWYDARVGRWLSEDPIGFAAADGNLYRYVKTRPTDLVDSLGFEDSQVVFEYYDISGPYWQLTEKLEFDPQRGLGWGKAESEFYVRQVQTIATSYRRAEWYFAPGVFLTEWICRIRVRISFGVRRHVITLPRWTDYGPAEKDHQNAWDGMIRALREHEMGHVAISNKFAGDVEFDVVGFGCTKAEARRDAERRRVATQSHILEERLRWIQRLHESYDRNTEYGRRQGVDLPQI